MVFKNKEKLWAAQFFIFEYTHLLRFAAIRPFFKNNKSSFSKIKNQKNLIFKNHDFMRSGAAAKRAKKRKGFRPSLVV